MLAILNNMFCTLVLLHANDNVNIYTMLTHMGTYGSTIILILSNIRWGMHNNNIIVFPNVKYLNIRFALPSVTHIENKITENSIKLDNKIIVNNSIFMIISFNNV